MMKMATFRENDENGNFYRYYDITNVVSRFIRKVKDTHGAKYASPFRPLLFGLELLSNVSKALRIITVMSNTNKQQPHLNRIHPKASNVWSRECHFILTMLFKTTVN